MSEIHFARLNMVLWLIASYVPTVDYIVFAICILSRYVLVLPTLQYLHTYCFRIRKFTFTNLAFHNDDLQYEYYVVVAAVDRHPALVRYGEFCT